jgi:hypothetical protein
MRTPFDRFAKETLSAVLSLAGSVEAQVEISTNARFVDLRYDPDPARLAALEPFGLLGRMAQRGPCLFEFFHAAPSINDVLRCIAKQIEARRSSNAPNPRLWIIAAGRPTTALRELGFVQQDAFYALTRGWDVELVVVSELEATRDTLMLRLLGAGAVLGRASAELAELRTDAPEWQAVHEIVLTLKNEIERAAPRAAEDEEFVMAYGGYVWEREGELLSKGQVRGMALSILSVYESRFGAAPADVRDAVQNTTDEAQLTKWLRVVGVESREEVESAIRSH